MNQEREQEINKLFRQYGTVVGSPYMVEEVNRFATIVHVRMDQMGGLEKSFTNMRLAGGACQFVAPRMIDPTLLQQWNVVGKICDNIAAWGFTDAWWGFTQFFEPAMKGLEANGFKLAGHYHRWVWNFPANVPDAPDVEFRQFDLKDEKFAEIFDASCTGADYLEFNKNREHIRSLYQFENHTHHAFNGHRAIYIDGKPEAACCIFMAEKKASNNRVYMTPFIPAKLWANGTAEKILKRIVHTSQKDGYDSICICMDETQTVESDFLSSMGFKKESEYPRLHRHTPYWRYWEKRG